MEDKIKSALTYVRQGIAYHEQCGVEVTEEVLGYIMNDASNIFADNYDEYNKIFIALDKLPYAVLRG